MNKKFVNYEKYIFVISASYKNTFRVWRYWKGNQQTIENESANFHKPIMHGQAGSCSFMNGMRLVVTQNFAVEISFHDDVKYTDVYGTIANPCPDVDLQWMFWLWLPFRWFADLSVTCACVDTAEGQWGTRR